jgi:hypothetical protein
MLAWSTWRIVRETSRFENDSAHLIEQGLLSATGNPKKNLPSFEDAKCSTIVPA